jgi:hypothetical protein
MSPPRATVSTMPSSIAQKNVRLPSSLTFWIDRTKRLPPSVTDHRVGREHQRRQLRDVDPDHARVLGDRRLAVDLGTTRRPGSAPVTTIFSLDGTKCSVLNTRNGAGERTSARTAQSVWNAPPW